MCIVFPLHDIYAVVPALKIGRHRRNPGESTWIVKKFPARPSHYGYTVLIGVKTIINHPMFDGL